MFYLLRDIPCSIPGFSNSLSCWPSCLWLWLWEHWACGYHCPSPSCPTSPLTFHLSSHHLPHLAGWRLCNTSSSTLPQGLCPCNVFAGLALPHHSSFCAGIIPSQMPTLAHVGLQFYPQETVPLSPKSWRAWGGVAGAQGCREGELEMGQRSVWRTNVGRPRMPYQ